MRKHMASFLTLSRRPLRQVRRGMALITTLLLLLLLTAMAVTMVLAVSSDLLINGYYRNYRSSFYAADSGLNIVRQAMLNGLVAPINTATFSPTTQAIPPGTHTTVLNAITAAYTSSFTTSSNRITGAGTGQAANSWPGRFKIDPNTITLTPYPDVANYCKLTGGNTGATCAAPAGNVTGYVYKYRYTLSAWGQSYGNEQVRIDDAGFLNITAQEQNPPTTQTPFSAYGTFIDNYAVCSATFVPGTLTGPFFTNGGWTFGTGSYIFTDLVESASANAGFWPNSGGCSAHNASSWGGIAPTFQNGFHRSQTPRELPSSDFDQKRAVLDGIGYCGGTASGGCAPVQNSEMHTALKDVTKTAYPSGGASTGVFLPYTVDASGNATFAGGGILVEGNAASVALSTSGSSGQVFTITQGSSPATVTTITVDMNANTTTVSSRVGAASPTTLTINGVPQQLDPTTSAVMRDATMLYVDGNIGSDSTNKGLSGPGAGVAAIQDGAAITVTAAGSVNITGDILYKTQPVTHDASDALIPGHDNGQVLGIFTASGNITMDNQQSSQNIEVDASIAMIKEGGSGGWYNAGSNIGTLTLVGGRIASNAIPNVGAVNTRNIWFDRRFLANGFAPPWFPWTTVESSGSPTTEVTPTIQRTYWANQSSYY